MMTFLLFAPASTKWLGWRKSRKSQREFLRVCVLWHHNKQINLVCQTQIISGADRLDPTDHKYLKVKRVKFNKKTDPETMKPQPRLLCYLYHNFSFSLSILLSQSKQSKLYFPVYKTPFSSMSTFACVIWCSRPPNSERDITDTQSRYANRKSYVTLNCRRAFQIWRITDIDKKESFTKVEIIPWSVLRYFMLRPLVFVICSFLFHCDIFRLWSQR